MTINYGEPLSRAFRRMTTALFKPFDLARWFVIGFTAFLAGLTDGPAGGSLNNHSRASIDFDDILELPHYAWGWLTDHPGWFAVIVFGIPLLITLIIVFIWLSSRGKFMFLDNVIHNEARVVKPWHDFRMQGQSLFFWRLGFGIICIIVIGLFLFQGYIIAQNIYDNDYSLYSKIILITTMVLLGLAMIVIIAYTSLFLNDFIVPIMYKNNIATTQAWHRFLPLLSNHLLYFFIYGLLVFLLHIFVVICIVLIGLLTCCIGILLLIIPYIGSVITLPISYTFRAFGPEFLEQFGPEFRIFPHSDETAIADTNLS